MESKTPEPGCWVKLKSIKKIGKLQTVSGKRAKVLIGDIAIQCKLCDLEICEAPISKPSSKKLVHLPNLSAKEVSSLHAIDLHGKTQLEAIQLLEQHINRAALAGLSRVDVMHGLGSGRVMEATHRLLSSLPIVKSFKLDTLNPGITRVYL